MVVPMTGLEFVLVVLFVTGLGFMTGRMVDTGLEFVIIVLVLTGFGYITGSLIVTGLVVLLMMCFHPGFEDSGQMGIKQE